MSWPIKHNMTPQTKIQRMIDSAAPGSTVTVPPGTYLLSPRNWLNGVTPYGISRHALLISKPLTLVLTGVTLITESKYKYGQILVTSSNVHIVDGFLTGDEDPNLYNSGQLLPSRCGILFTNGVDCSVTGTELKFFSQGVNLTRTVGAQLTNVKASYCHGSGIINFNSDNTVIDGCEILNCDDGALSMYDGGTNNLLKNTTITENRPERIGKAQGLTLEKEIGSTFQNLTITGYFYGIDIKNASHDCIFENNEVHQCQFNISIRYQNDPGNPNADSDGMIIRNNNVLDALPWISGIGNAGIIIKSNGTGHHIVEGNTVRNDLLIVGITPYRTNVETTLASLVGNIFVA